MKVQFEASLNKTTQHHNESQDIINTQNISLIAPVFES